MLRGSIVALVTPFTTGAGIDEERLRFLIEWHIKNKTDAILVCGTTGESATLSHQEHKQVVGIAVEESGGRIPIVAGAGSNSTAEAVELAKHAKRVGADALLVITPYYNKPTQQGLYYHYKQVSSQGKLPTVMYNVPSRTGVNILPETADRIYRDCKNIAGIKEASGSLDQITRIMTLVDRKFMLFSGSDELNVPVMSVGGTGAISVLANIMPGQTHSLIEDFLKGKVKQSLKKQLYLYRLIKSLFLETNPIPVKTALGMMGMLEPVFRMPLCRMEKNNGLKLKETLKSYKLI